MQIGYLMPGFRVSFRVWGVFGFRSFRFFVFSRSVSSARFPLLLGCFCCRGLSVSGPVWGCLGALFGVVFVQLGRLESVYLETGICTFSLLNPSSKHGHLPKNILVQTVRSAANRIARKNLTPFRWQICRQ